MTYTASKLIEIATAEIGYLEKKTNSQLDSHTANAGDKNWTKYARDLHEAGYYNGNKNGYAWCDVWTDWLFYMLCEKDSAKAQKMICQTGDLGAGCIYSAKYYRKAGRFYKTPKVGDQIFFGTEGKETHTGIVYKVDSSRVYTIEGNTSGASGVVANGGGVCKKSYSLTYKKIVGYGRPYYDVEIETEPEKPVYVPTVKQWQIAALADGFEFPKHGADGEWGAECASVARKAVVKKRVVYMHKNLTKLVQRVVGTTVDGKCGKDTHSAIFAYQRKHGLEADGKVGLNTWKKILNVE